uniref:Uncharacterized protein n=1 Tax=Rhipicephalus zambeziensis TaxID=60191 RepID=A0A224Y790_9ACAR
MSELCRTLLAGAGPLCNDRNEHQQSVVAVPLGPWFSPANLGSRRLSQPSQIQSDSSNKPSRGSVQRARTENQASLHEAFSMYPSTHENKDTGQPSTPQRRRSTVSHTHIHHTTKSYRESSNVAIRRYSYSLAMSQFRLKVFLRHC